MFCILVKRRYNLLMHYIYIYVLAHSNNRIDTWPKHTLKAHRIFIRTQYIGDVFAVPPQITLETCARLHTYIYIYKSVQLRLVLDLHDKTKKKFSFSF